MRLITKEALGYNDVTALTDFSELDSRSDVDIDFNGISPMISAPMYHLGTPEFLAWCARNKIITTLHRYFDTPEAQHNMYTLANIITPEYTLASYCYYAVGKDKNWINALLDMGVTRFCVDMAHGNSKICYDTIEYIKDRYTTASIMAGNIESVDAYIRMRDLGVKYVRVGIAGGSICSTNKATAVGLPVLTALKNIREFVDTFPFFTNLPIIIADGGIDGASNALKAIAFGADMVMAGRFFAGTSLAKGPFYTKTFLPVDREEYPFFANSEPYYVEYAGMASSAMRNVTKSQKMDTSVSVEGVSGVTPYMGQTQDVYDAFLANMKAGVSYIGASTLNEYRDEVVYQRISIGGQYEKDTHIIERERN